MHARACVGGEAVAALAQQQLQYLVLVQLAQHHVFCEAHLRGMRMQSMLSSCGLSGHAVTLASHGG